ncbi:hypothetical protein K450DRAFT_282521 [Umbelopsis ramanniana AG]|uniref:Uncharacterized protein n=1 Tax=Umbelopsis ramanniana AG TaxID=1314678 RepID=A0AAD5HCX1_UMBRA|nr:uncharacterized protein K450DRAFT_282521 [Umbelopsis ramanniana AG]KAI8577593.1 hypothetical protein K450DRAFT_282521 [Umbelopsis ramanniana AG]
MDRIKTFLGDLLRPAEAPSSFDALLGEDRDEREEIVSIPPEDSYNLVYWIFVLQGAAMLLPWNVFITASTFFASRFAQTPYGETFQNYFSTYFTVSNLAFFAYALWKQKKASANARVVLAVLINTVAFTIIMVTVPMAGFSGLSYFYFIMFLVVLTAATTSFFQIGVFAAASRFPHKYLQGVMSGQALAGTAVALSSILSALAASPTTKPDEEAIRKSAVLYFLSALLITVVALVGYLVLLRQPFFMYYMADRPTGNSLLRDEDNNDDDSDPEMVFQPDVAIDLTILGVLKKIKWLAFSVAYVFVVTIAVFPSITALVKSVRAHPPDSSVVNVQLPRVLQDDIFVAFHFLIFNIFDWVGRIFPLSSLLRTSNPKLLTFYSLLRTTCIPLFLFCNVVAADKTLPVLINSDFVYFMLLILFSLTNGWIGSLCMMAIPDLSSLGTPEEKSLGGSIMSFCLCVGLAIGGVSSFVVRSMV